MPRIASPKILRSVSRGQAWIGVMFKSPVLGFCHIEVVGDEKKFPHASDQGNFGLLVVIGNEMLVERLYTLIVLDTVHTSEVQDLPEHWISCPADFPSSVQGRS